MAAKEVAPRMEEERQSRRKSKKDSKELGKETLESCRDCECEIKSGTKALSCNFCHKWVCTKCLEVPDELYEILVQNPKSLLLVPCKACSGQISSLQEMRDTLSDVKSNQDGTKKQLESLSKKMVSLKKDLQKTVTDLVKAEVGSQLGSKLEDMEERWQLQMQEKLENHESKAAPLNQDQIKDLVKEAFREERLKEKRKANLMMFNLPERSSRNLQERKKYDMHMVVKVLRVLADNEEIEDKIVKAVRMGRWSKESNKHPIKVVCKDVDTKFNFLQKSYRLKIDKDEVIKTVRIGTDRTPEEQRKYKELKLELDRRISEGERDLAIRKGQIVSLKPREVENPQSDSETNLETEEEINMSAGVDSPRKEDEFIPVFTIDPKYGSGPTSSSEGNRNSGGTPILTGENRRV